MANADRLAAFGVLVLALVACNQAAGPTPAAAGSPRATSSAPLASAPAAGGSEIAVGRYECQQFVTGSGWSYFGWVEIQPGGDYDSNGGGGTYAYDSGTGAVEFTGTLYDNEFAGEYPKGSDNKSLRMFFYTDPDLLEIICSPPV